VEVTPSLVLAMWAAGVAFGAAVVSYWTIVGPGYNWLLAGILVLIGGATSLAGGVWLGIAATVAALGAGVFGRKRVPAAGLFAVAGIGYLLVAVEDGGVAPAVTGALLLGGTTSVMLLGHWFLVDPRLPRQALQRLDAATALGWVAELGAIAVLGAFGSGDTVMVAALAALAVLTGLLVAAVWFALKEPAYSGVMAATGLSYLGVLTAFGVVVIGRLLVAGL